MAVYAATGSIQSERLSAALTFKAHESTTNIDLMAANSIADASSPPADSKAHVFFYGRGSSRVCEFLLESGDVIKKLVYSGPWYTGSMPDGAEVIRVKTVTSAILGHICGYRHGKTIFLSFNPNSLYTHSDGYQREVVNGVPNWKSIPAGPLADEVVNSVLKVEWLKAAAAAAVYDWERLRRAYVNERTSLNRYMQQDVRDSIRRQQSEISNHEYAIRAAQRQLATLQKTLETMQSSGSSSDATLKAEKDFEILKSMMSTGSITNLRISLDTPFTLSFDTGKILVKDEHEDSTWKGTYLGPYRVSVDLATAEPVIRPLNDSAPRAEGYPHPHITSSGGCCLGNAASYLEETCETLDIPNIVSVVLTFLSKYNDDNPYINMEAFDDSYESERRGRSDYEDCYDDASTVQCVTCEDDGCPYKDDAVSRCRDNMSSEDCVGCRSCGVWRDAQDECFGDNGGQQCCTDCTHRHCKYNRNYTECRKAMEESGDLEVCASGCSATACPHHGKGDSEEDKD